MKLGFSFKFSLIFAFVLLLEIVIAIFIHDSFTRTFFGDVLVIILLYGFVRMVSKTEHLPVVIGVLLFSYLVEFGQYFNLISLLKLQDVKLAKIIIGTTYDGMDLVAYLAGALILIMAPIVIKLLKKVKCSRSVI
jgi:DNA integrity scanning protein DisA with diadenylate cyclase activity